MTNCTKPWKDGEVLRVGIYVIDSAEYRKNMQIRCSKIVFKHSAILATKAIYLNT